MSATGIEKIVCEDIATRKQLGIPKYGTTVAENPLPLREWLRHAYEESLDKSVYLRRAIAEIDAQTVVKESLTSQQSAAGDSFNATVSETNYLKTTIPETTYESSDVRCPYCLELQSDSWELGGGSEGCDTMECGHCEKEFTWERSVSVTYKGIPPANAASELQPDGKATHAE